MTSMAKQAAKHVRLTSMPAIKKHFETGNFVDDDGNVVKATSVSLQHGILSVTFEDGSILNCSN